MAGNSNQLVVMNGTYLMKSRYKIPALEEQLKFEDPFQKAISKQLKMILEPFQTTNEWWKQSHHQ